MIKLPPLPMTTILYQKFRSIIIKTIFNDEIRRVLSNFVEILNILKEKRSFFGGFRSIFNIFWLEAAQLSVIEMKIFVKNSILIA